jgi:predicted phosphodiesterase
MAVLLHLSDIHFRKSSDNPFDIDSDLRNELILDAKHVNRELLGKPDAILVGGDIAYSGHADEYAHAKIFLEELASKVDTTLASLWGVPGNHDVNQTCIRQSTLLLDNQNAIRGAAPKGSDKKILDYLVDPVGKAQLYKSIEEFNTFAEPFGFNFGAERPHYHIDTPLNDGSLLRINSLNSTLVSNHLDNTARSVVLGRHQLPKREEGVTHLVLCHHPPDWWADDDELETAINNRAHIQLYGHKHSHRLIQIENSVKLVAGAVHPERNEDNWIPRYNWLDVKVVGTFSSRQLQVTVFPRVWLEGSTKFIADTNNCGGLDRKVFTLSLEAWNSEDTTTSGLSDSNAIAANIAPAGTSTMNSPLRLLTYRLLDLPLVKRFTVAQRLNLIRDEDAGLNDHEVFRRVLRRAVDEHRLHQLWNDVQSQYTDGKFPTNPFSSGS